MTKTTKTPFTAKEVASRRAGGTWKRHAVVKTEAAFQRLLARLVDHAEVRIRDAEVGS